MCPSETWDVFGEKQVVDLQIGFFEMGKSRQLIQNSIKDGAIKAVFFSYMIL